MARRVVERVPHTWIPLADGRRLAARIWLPVDAGSDPVPAVLECHPYRKGDMSAIGDDARYRPLASHGYACVRVDLAGSGDSDGFIDDEYLPVELDDIVEAIGWVRDQAWCTGRVGLQGISWSGFNTLAVAARRPEGLVAVISACASDDRFADDVHYLGGCVVASEMASWATTMLALGALPPDPDIVGDAWRASWLARLEHAPQLAETWLSHQDRDQYWQHASVGDDPEAITCPVFLVGGWADGYRNGALRLAAALSGPVKLLIGPWGHGWPDSSGPGPNLDFGTELRQWWDHWLKDEENGAIEPPVRLWMQDAVRPATSYDQRPGRWLAGPRWPLPELRPTTLHLAAPGGRGALVAAQPADDARARDAGAADGGVNDGGAADENTEIIEHRGQLAPASYPGAWCAAGRRGDFPGDQRAVDAQWLTFTSDDLEQGLELLGQPEVELEVAADQPLALVGARLGHVWPDGASTLITRGLLNLAHAGPHETPARLEPGRWRAVRIQLQGTSYRVPAGHRLRLSLSSGYWPLAWPSPHPVTLSVRPSSGRLILPCLPGPLTDARTGPGPAGVHQNGLEAGGPEADGFGSPKPDDAGSSLVYEVVPTAVPGRRTELRYLPGPDRTEMVVARGGPGIRFEDGLHFALAGHDVMSVTADDPLTARATSERTVDIGRSAWQTRVEAATDMTCTADHFILDSRLTAYEGQDLVHQRQWRREVPRHLC